MAFVKSLVKWFSNFYQRNVDARGRFGSVIRRFRRFYIGSFRPDYIKKSIEQTREGECHRTGMCCQLIYKCPFLGRDSENKTYCRVYGDLRPANCRHYPFDKRDSEVEGCGYRFK